MHITLKSLRSSFAAVFVAAVAVLAVACGGSEDVGTSSSDLSRGDGTCPMSACKGQDVVCQSGTATNVRCVSDPNAGAGSDPVGHCIITADCPEP